MAYRTPRIYQELMRDFALHRRRCNLFASPGLGKTSEAINIYDTLRTFDKVQRMLVLAPKRVALSTWPMEIEKWRDSFGHLSVAAAIGTQDERLAALRRNAHITTINYDNIDWLIDTYGIDNWPFDMVVADESTRLKGLRIAIKKHPKTGKEYLAGQGAKRPYRLAKLAHTKVRHWINLTGSPAPNGLQDLWGQQFFIDRGATLGLSFSAFQQRFFTALFGDDNRPKLVPQFYAQQIIQDLMRPSSLAVDARDYFDIKEPIEIPMFIDLPPRARQQYKEMEKELFTWIDEHPLEAVNSGAKAQKCLQLGSGSVIIDTKSGTWKAVHDEKLQMLESIVEETSGANLLVSYQFKSERARIMKAFPFARELDSKRQTIEDFQQGKIRMLLAHPASAGHGLDLQHNCHVLVDYTSNFNLEYDEQILERVGPTRQWQIGSNEPVFRYRIIARNTIEHNVVLPVVQKKATTQQAFKQAMKAAA